MSKQRSETNYYGLVPIYQGWQEFWKRSYIFATALAVLFDLACHKGLSCMHQCLQPSNVLCIVIESAAFGVYLSRHNHDCCSFPVFFASVVVERGERSEREKISFQAGKERKDFSAFHWN